MRIAREVALYNQGGIQNGIDGAEDRASKVATSFITRVSESEGIKVHNADDLTDYIQINSNGVDLVNDNVSIANFGESARVGKNGASRFMINADSLEAYDDNNSKYFEVSADGITFGSDAVASTAYADQAEADAKTYADGKASTAEANAKKEATNYMNFTSAGGLNIAAENPSTATRKVNISSSGVKVQNDANNYSNVSSSGLEVYQGGSSVAKFGSSARIGPQGDNHLTITTDGFMYGTDTVDAFGLATDSTGSILLSDNDISVWPQGGTLAGGTLSVEGNVDVARTLEANKVKSNGVLLEILKLTDFTGPYAYPLPITITNSKITANMEVIHSVLSNPSAQTGDWTVTTSNGSLTISGTQSDSTYITLYLAEPRT